MTTVAKVAKELDLIGIDEKTAINATNKSKMRDALKAYGVPIPMYFSVEDYDQYIKAIDNLRNKKYKCIVKPADNSGSRGIRLVENYDIDQLKKIYDYCKKNSNSGKLVVEEYMQGPEVSVETISRNGTCNVIQITDKLTTGAPYFVEIGHNQPSQLPIDIIEKIKKVAIDANKAIGIKNGPSHTEIKVTKDGPKIVELGARLGGDNITTHLVPYSTGVNMVEACINIALGQEVDIRKKFQKASATRYKKCDVGKIIKITGVDQANKIQGVKDVKIVHGVGEESRQIKSSNDRVAYVISQAENTSKATLSCEKALEKIKIEVEK